MAIPKLIIDSGNYQVKAICGQSSIDFLHLIAPITKFQFEDGISRFKDKAQDFLHLRLQSGDKMVDHYFVVGETAMRHDVMRRQGAVRYERSYYGPLFAATVARVSSQLGKKNSKGVYTDLIRDGLKVVASHASRDHRYAGQLRESIEGDWEFQCGEDHFNFKAHVEDVYEEPFGGYARRAFVKKSDGSWSTPLAKHRVGIIDIGGGTVGVLTVNGGKVDYNSADSAGQGVNLAVDRLKDSLKVMFPKFFMQAKDIPSDVLQECIRTKTYRGKGQEFSVAEAVDEALYPLFNEVKTLWSEKMNAGLALDKVLLTGGGNILLSEWVKGLLEFPDESVLMAAPDAEHMPKANVEGAKAYYEMLEWHDAQK